MDFFRAGSMELQVDGTGLVQSIRVSGGPNLVPAKHPSPLLSLRIGGKVTPPQTSVWNPKNHLLTLGFVDHKAKVKIVAHDSHLAMELVAVQPRTDVEVVIWGPYATSLKGPIGETIGVVQGRGNAFGLQILNVKTLGGFPNTEDDIEPSYDIFDTGNLVDMNDRDAATENYRGDTARPTDFGSVVQAYTRNRASTRIIENWGHRYYTAPAFKDGGVVGSKIALFGCPAADALSTMGAIELVEGLPHPIIDGVWGKVSPTAHESYLVMGFDAQNLDECLAITTESGLRYLYSDGCFETWGHFKLNPKGFPKGWESMKECVDRAKAKGVRLGVHTLSNFITTNDSYVTPIPDRRLAEVGATSIVGDIDATQTDLVIEDPKFFNQMGNNTLKSVRVDDELVQYDSVSSQAPWRLLKCKRGAFATTPAVHKSGSRIAKLMDHGYQTFLTNAELTQEVASRIAKLFNQTGLKQLSMDGLEGNWSTGMGQYGRALFAKTWYDALKPGLKGEVINDASNPGPYNWHLYTRMNWGEPWYAGFRKSQTLYRLKNQHYFKRNLMPGMLGWFQLTSETTLEDIQWLLARAAGFDAGFCITASLDSIHHNPHEHEILAAVKAWESARRSRAFPDSMLAGLQDINREFELTQSSANSWAITSINSHKFSVSSNPARLDFRMPSYTHGTKLIVQVPSKVKVSGLKVTIDGIAAAVDWPTGVEGYRQLTLDLSGALPGDHRLEITGSVAGMKDAALDCELRTPDSEPLGIKAK